MQGEKVEEPMADAPEDAETEASAHVDEVTRQEPAQEARKRVASGS